MWQIVSDVQKEPPPLKLPVCQTDAVVVQDAVEVVPLDVSLSVVVKLAKHSDHSSQVASYLWGSHTVIDINSNSTPRRCRWTPEPNQLVRLGSLELFIFVNTVIDTPALICKSLSLFSKVLTTDGVRESKEEMQRSDRWNKEKRRRH